MNTPGDSSTDSTDIAYFVSMYGADPDPWGFDHAWYERRKFAVTLAALPRARYRRAIEPGCSNGALTELLATRCDEVVAFDVIDDAVRRARRRTRHLGNVEVTTGALPHHPISGTADLVVWSEIAYYLGTDDGEQTLRQLDGLMEIDGDLVSVHYTGDTDYPRTGRSIAEWIDGVAWLDRLVTHGDDGFDLGIWRRVGR